MVADSFDHNNGNLDSKKKSREFPEQFTDYWLKDSAPWTQLIPKWSRKLYIGAVQKKKKRLVTAQSYHILFLSYIF
jgi:hypothetical protein